ncbi:MAG: TIGR02757 family protein [Proteobacteria bacterium]|nr:TIGR02757 family protein [Pseudomonadota bacterium]
MTEDVGRALHALLHSTDVDVRRAADPVAFPHRYQDPRDIEVAAFFASQLAFGRVASFAKPLELLLAEADAHGGPRRWVDTFDGSQPGALKTLNYRWIRPDDFVGITAALRDVLDTYGTLACAFAGETARAALTQGVAVLATAAEEHCEGPLTRGRKAFLSSPAGGSACKRWCMFLRWMVRPSDGIDFGIWTHIPPATLVIPLDTHVHRIARLVGLTDRATANWRTAEAITAALGAWDADDPVRFDFALAHLGISGSCTSQFSEAVCPECALRRLCTVGRGGQRPKGK